MKKEDPARWNGYKEDEIPRTCETCQDLIVCYLGKECPEDYSGCKHWMISFAIFEELEKQREENDR